MQLAQKISISLDPSMLSFVDRYVADHSAKGRSAAVTKALQLLQSTEQENLLAQAYAQSSEQDKKIAFEFDATLTDGLTMPETSEHVSNETW